jgi:geranylgeranyl transferase type-1 subunit beta
MWRGTDFGDLTTAENAKWDPANVPATYFALVALLILGDDFKRVNRKGILQWLRYLQREDGSFGETLVDGHIEGGRDPRFGYCATAVRYILRGTIPGPLDVDGVKVVDIGVDSLVDCIRKAEVRFRTTTVSNNADFDIRPTTVASPTNHSTNLTRVTHSVPWVR